MSETNPNPSVDAKQELEALLQDVIEETGASLKTGAAELAEFAAERSAHLATLVGDPGFDQAVRAERDAVALRAGLVTTHEADAADQRIVGAIHGGLRVLARALA